MLANCFAQARQLRLVETINLDRVNVHFAVRADDVALVAVKRGAACHALAHVLSLDPVVRLHLVQRVWTKPLDIIVVLAEFRCHASIS